MTSTTTSAGTGFALPFQRRVTGRVGSLVYTGAITPHDRSSGAVVTSTSQLADPSAVHALRFGAMFLDVIGDRAFAQAWQAYDNLAAVLAGHGLDLSRLCRQRIYVRDLRDLPVIERVADAFFDSTTVATTIVQIADLGLDPAIALQIEAVALAADGGEKEVIAAEGPGGPDARYPGVVKAGGFLFTSAVSGVNPATGTVARTVDEMGDAASLFDVSPYRTPRQHAILAQAWFTFQRLEQLLSSAGGRLGDILKVNGWLDFPMRDFDPLRPVREHLFSALEDKVASTGLWVGPNPTPGSLLSYDAVAVAPDNREPKEVRIGPSRIIAYYVGACAGGGAVFTCGEVPIDEEKPEAITEPHQLEDAARLLKFGRLEALSGIEARAVYTYRKLAEHLSHYGSSLDMVEHQTVYLPDMRQHAALELVAKSVFGGVMPATTTVPIVETSPFFQDARLEIEVVARRQ